MDGMGTAKQNGWLFVIFYAILYCFEFIVVILVHGPGSFEFCVSMFFLCLFRFFFCYFFLLFHLRPLYRRASFAFIYSLAVLPSILSCLPGIYLGSCQSPLLHTHTYTLSVDSSLREMR